MRDRRPLIAGLALLAFFALVAVFAPALARHPGEGGALIPFGPLQVQQAHILEAPSARHWLGTDQVGRDVLSRALHGGRSSLGAGALATLIAVAIGAGSGALAGASRWRPLDTALARGADLALAFPALIGAMVLLSAAEERLETVPDALAVGVVVGLFSWPALFRFVRAEVRQLADSDLAAAARVVGATPSRTALRHLLPHAFVPALVPASFLAGSTVLAEAGLGLLGLGVDPPYASWGNLLRDGMNNVEYAWWLIAVPGALVFGTVLACYLVGEGLRRHLARDTVTTEARG